MLTRCIYYLSVFTTLWPTGHSFTSQNTPPVFEFKREWLIPENELVGRRIATVQTKDKESDPIEYGIEPAVFLDGSNFFSIHKKTGVVVLSNSLEGQAGNDYYLFVTANDGHQTAKIEVYVRVLERNQRPEEPTIEVPFSTSNPPRRGGTRLRPFPPHLFIPSSSNTSNSSTFAYDPSKKAFPASKPSHSIPSSPSSTSFPSFGKPTLPPVSTEGGGTKGGKKTRQGGDITPTVLSIISVILFAILTVFVFFCLRKRCMTVGDKGIHKKVSVRRESSETSTTDLGYFSNAFYQHRIPSSPFSSRDYRRTMTDEQRWEYPRHHLHFLGILGEGCFGQVWKCETAGSKNREMGRIVAVKTMKENSTEREKKDLLKELDILKLLDPHPNVVSLLGCCTERDPIFLILEYVPYGKLQTYLRESRAERFYGSLYRNSKFLTSQDLTSFVYQIARGMEYISSKGIIHRDLAARNVLVGENKVCKIADFGFARDVVFNHVYERKSEGCLPIRWMAPESLYDNLFSTKSDVWSFGVLMWENVTLGSTPYPGLGAAEVMRRVRDGYRLEKPKHCKREMYNIMYYCWDSNPKIRPSFSELVGLLDRLLMTEEEYIELDRFPDHSYYNLTDLSGEKL